MGRPQLPRLPHPHPQHRPADGRRDRAGPALRHPHVHTHSDRAAHWEASGALRRPRHGALQLPRPARRLPNPGHCAARRRLRHGALREVAPGIAAPVRSQPLRLQQLLRQPRRRRRPLQPPLQEGRVLGDLAQRRPTRRGAGPRDGPHRGTGPRLDREQGQASGSAICPSPPSTPPSSPPRRGWTGTPPTTSTTIS